MIYDKEFLLQLDNIKHKNVYARITALTFQEHPVETIEGRITQGSINIDGASAVRRTCSLTIVAQDFDYSDYLWGFNTKFKLEVGLRNTIDTRYPEIVWFPQGIYLITSFNTSHSTNNFTISLQGKDKMCLLNGDIGGSLNSSVDFGTIEEEDRNGNWIIRKLPIREIIRNMVHQYGGEPLHNIVINDIPEFGLELLEYRYDIPMYLYKEENSPRYKNATLDGTIKCKVNGQIKTLADLEPTVFDMLVDPLMGNDAAPTPVEIEKNQYIIAKVEYGQTAGYRKTDLVYAGDLIANIGESVTSVLDKIKNMLGEYEYFYDLNGQFIFQQKRSFVNTLYSPIKDNSGENNNESYIESLAQASTLSYTFNQGEQITTFNNNPNLLNLRNDYSIWGQRMAVSGAQVPVHMRYAIDTKPRYYKSITVLDEEVSDYNDKYGTFLQGQESTIYISADTYLHRGGMCFCDWREVMYQMALDFYKYNHLDDFELKVAAANPDQYPSGITGYEQYYIDLQGFWRQLYDPGIDDEIDIDRKENYYYDPDNQYQYWNKSVYEKPEALNFWFDFLDTEGELSQFNVKAIGSRPKVVNDSNVKSIYFRDTPEVFFIDNVENNEDDDNKKYIQAPGILKMFSISAQGKSAKNKLDELIYQHSYCADSISINCIPIYYLEPNTRIRVFDKKTNINGEYVISKMSIPLTYNGTMSITATKAAENFMY